MRKADTFCDQPRMFERRNGDVGGRFFGNRSGSLRRSLTASVHELSPRERREITKGERGQVETHLALCTPPEFSVHNLVGWDCFCGVGDQHAWLLPGSARGMLGRASAWMRILTLTEPRCIGGCNRYRDRACRYRAQSFRFGRASQFRSGV